MASSMAFEVDWTVVLVVFFAVSTTRSAFGLRQKSSHSTSHTNAASTSTETINQIILPTMDTLFCSYIPFLASCLPYTMYDSRIVAKKQHHSLDTPLTVTSIRTACDEADCRPHLPCAVPWANTPPSSQPPPVRVFRQHTRL